jgi:putative Holliday junction resolvase
MPIVDPLALEAARTAGLRLMALDVGEKTIGVAICDAGLTVATPLETIRRTKFAADVERLRALVQQRGIGGLVVGLPVDLRGREGRRCQSVRQFAANLLERLDLPLAFWDERLSTVAVTRAMLEADLSRRRRAEAVDKAAAAYILQGLLDRLASARRAATPA